MHLISKARHVSTKSAHLYWFILDQALPVNIPTYVHTFCIAQCFYFNLEETKTQLKETCPKFALSLLLRYVRVECMSFFHGGQHVLNACFLSVVVR